MPIKVTDIKKGTHGFFSEFWKFAAKGNAVQLAVAVVLGTAFGAIVNSLVADIIMPLLSFATNNVDFSSWSYVLRPAVGEAPALVIGYGKLIQSGINFLIIGLSIFLMFKLLSGVAVRFRKQEEAEPPVPVSTQEKLLGEIRDLLKDQETKNFTNKV